MSLPIDDLLKFCELFETKVSRASETLFHVTPSKNVAKIMKNGLMPLIGKRSKKLGEKVPAIYFFKTMEDVETAAEMWLFDEFSENTKLALLKVTLPPDAKIIKGAEFEVVVGSTIPPSNIQVITTNFGNE